MHEKFVVGYSGELVASRVARLLEYRLASRFADVDNARAYGNSELVVLRRSGTNYALFPFFCARLHYSMITYLVVFSDISPT